MTIVCFCGATFAKVDLLYQHATTHGHRIRCCCDSLFGTHKQLLNHQKAVTHDVRLTCTKLELLKGRPGGEDAIPNECHTCCNKTFKGLDALEQHMIDKHPSCPTCKQVFFNKAKKNSLPAREQLRRHQEVTGHCFCEEHEATFGSARQFQAHNRMTLHFTSFECMDCHRNFVSQRALDDHFAGKDHTRSETGARDKGPTDKATAEALALLEEANLKCEACDQTFIDTKAFKQHKESVKHNPLSDLRCPMSAACGRVFTSPSALVFHLESGGCKSGMNRLKLNDIAHAHDIDRIITSAENASLTTTKLKNGTSDNTVLSKLGLSISSLSISASNNIGTMIDCDDNSSQNDDLESSEAVLTPTFSASRIRSSSNVGVPLPPDDACDEWPYISASGKSKPSTTSVYNSTVDVATFDSVKNAWPCNICSRSFRKKGSRLDHLNSPAHAPKIFRCPAALLGLSGTKPTLAFKTLSGMAQHIESGACTGGKEALSRIMSIFESKIKAVVGGRVRLLRNST